MHLLLDETEHAQFRARAEAERLSLAEWLRLAARGRLERSRPARIASVEDLHAFFDERDAREVGREPDWEERLAVLARSRRGAGDPD